MWKEINKKDNKFNVKKMGKIKQWDEINDELGSNMSKFDEWLVEQDDVTIFVTGIFENDLESYRNEKERNT